MVYGELTVLMKKLFSPKFIVCFGSYGDVNVGVTAWYHVNDDNYSQ